MQKSVFAAGMLLLFLAASAQGFAAERKPAPEGPAQEQKPASSEKKIVIFVHDPRSSATITVPIASTEAADLPVAEVNGERITVDDFRAAVANIHEGQDEAKDAVQKAPSINLPELLKRLVNAQLIYQEAQNIGLDELPEVKDSINVFSQVTLRSLLREQIEKDVTASDEEVEKMYREMSREVKTSSAFFEKEKEAKKAARAIKAGKSFDEVVKKAVEAKSAQGTDLSGNFIKVAELDPAVAATLAKMKIGSISPVTKMNLGGKPYFVLFRYDAERFTEGPELKEQARQAVLGAKKTRALGAVVAALYKKYVKFNKEFFESLDYGPKGPGLEKLLEDQRIVVELQGDKPVTVADLSAAMQDKFYHGIKNLKGPKLIKAKREALEGVVQKRLLQREAIDRGIDQTGMYKNMVKDYKRSVVFGMFVQKVLAPSVKVTDEDLRAYYRDHAKEYLSAPMVKARSLAFGQKADAVSALDKLKKGADFAWVKNNAPGQAAAKENEDVAFPEGYVPLSSLAEDVQSAIAGAKSEEFRLYEGAQGLCYVLYVEDMVPPRPLAFEEVRETIRPKVFYDKLNQSVEEWIRKLKESADIKIYLAGSEK